MKVGGTATAHLTDVKIRGTSGQGTGVVMEGGTVTIMERVWIEGVKTGVYATNGRLVMKGGKIEFTSGAGNGNYGVGVGVSGGVVTMMGTKIVGTSGGTGKGVYATGTGKLVMSGVWIEGVGKGVEVSGEGMLEMMGNSTIIFTGDYGVKVGSGVASAILTDVKIMGKDGGTGMYGVQMTGEGTMVMNMVDILQVGVGVYASNGRLKMNMGKIEFTSGAGNGNYGVGVGVSGGVVTMMGTTIMGSGSGKGTGVYISGGAVMLSGVNISKVEKGVSASNGKLVMKGGTKITFAGGTGSYGVKVGSGGNALFYGVSITGSGREGTGVVMDGKMLMMDGVDISGVGMGVEVSEGNLVMHKGSIGFTGNYGIYLIRGNALLNDITITGPGDKSTGTGMYVGSSGKIVMKDVTM
ncbi:hypothetical protein, partial [Bartonella bovis]